MPYRYKAKMLVVGPRPPFGHLLDHIWGEGCNTDSDGDSFPAASTEWTELIAYPRDISGRGINIQPTSHEPLILLVSSETDDDLQSMKRFLIDAKACVEIA